jgi:hypothetical protein
MKRAVTATREELLLLGKKNQERYSEQSWKRKRKELHANYIPSKKTVIAGAINGKK